MSRITTTLDLNHNPAVLPPQAGFFYVDQGNYQTFTLDQPLTVYSDSATSCIITLVVANHGERNTVTIAHLDSPACISAFFERVAAQDAFSYQIFAQGANPPDNATSQENAKQLRDSIEGLGDRVISQQLSLLQGDPQQQNRGGFGLVYGGGDTAVATNQPYTLQLFQRDPTCGGQTVYCIMRRQEHPPQQIRNAGLPFTHQELVELASIAIRFRKDPNDPSSAFTNIVNLQSEEIRQAWSTTPADEAPWFSDQLKLGAAFAIAMAPVVNLSELYLSQTAPPKFTRLRKALHIKD